MIKYIEGNISDFISPNVIVPHVVNIHGIAASGVVVPIFKKIPLARSEYENLCCLYSRTPEVLLGECQIVETDQGNIANLYAQTLQGQRPLYYNHLVVSMEELAIHCKDYNRDIVSPTFGSLRAGGNWSFIEELITDCWIKRGIGVTVVQYKE